MSAAELVGDLAVLYVELTAARRPYIERHDNTTRGRFHSWYCFGDRLFRLAVETGIAVGAAVEPPRTALAALADAVQSDGERLVHELMHALEDGFHYIGYEIGYFYGGQPWDELCWFRSGLAFLAELTGIALEFDGCVDENLEKFGPDMYEPMEPPPGMPRSHWWWFDGFRPA